MVRCRYTKNCNIRTRTVCKLANYMKWLKIIMKQHDETKLYNIDWLHTFITEIDVRSTPCRDQMWMTW